MTKSYLALGGKSPLISGEERQAFEFSFEID
jgi:hypothetical protein